MSDAMSSGCEHCGTRIGGFRYAGYDFCCECMSSLCSWILDGGMAEAPELFAYVLADE